MIRALRKARVFRAVDYTHRFAAPPELRATVSLVEQVAVYQPYFSVLTLGLFPACMSEVRGYSFSLRSPRTKKSLDFDYTFKGYRCGGWLPFLFLIREQVTGSILFMGRVADPTLGSQ